MSPNLCYVVVGMLVGVLEEQRYHLPSLFLDNNLNDGDCFMPGLFCVLL